jgi:hypothetical protein
MAMTMLGCSPPHSPFTLDVHFHLRCCYLSSACQNIFFPPFRFDRGRSGRRRRINLKFTPQACILLAFYGLFVHLECQIYEMPLRVVMFPKWAKLFIVKCLRCGTKRRWRGEERFAGINVYALLSNLIAIRIVEANIYRFKRFGTFYVERIALVFSFVFLL